MKNVMMVAVVMACCAASGIGVVGKSRGAKVGEGKRMGATMVDRSKTKASTNAVVVADGVWKDKPGGLFGKKFGEAIPGKTILSGGKDERYVTFQPEKRFRKFTNYCQLVDPRTRLVYGLTCSTKFRDESEAKAEVAEVKSILKQKFPKGRILPGSSKFRIGYEEGGAIPVLSSELHWTLAVTITAPKSKGQMAASYEVVIRAIDDHFFPSEAAAPAEPSADLDSL